jgi:hypothetical protein
MPSISTVRIPTPIKKGAPVPSSVVSPASIRRAGLPFSQDLARDIESLSNNLNQLHTSIAHTQPYVSVPTANSLYNGSGSPPSALGGDGDFYIDTSADKIYGPKAGGVWPPTGVSLVGPQGPPGPTVWG